MEAERLSSKEIPLALCSILHSCQAAQQEHWLLTQKIRICVRRLMTTCRSLIMLHPLLFSKCFSILPWRVCLEKENSSVNLLPASHSSFSSPPSLPLFLPAKPADILFVSAVVTQPTLRREMAISQTEIFQYSDFRSPKLKCVTWEVSLLPVMLFYTCCKNIQSQTLESDQAKAEKKGFLQLQQALTDRMSLRSFTFTDLWYPRCSSPLPTFLLGLSHPIVTSLTRSRLPSFPLLLLSSSSGPARGLEEESLFRSGIKLLQSIKCNGD